MLQAPLKDGITIRALEARHAQALLSFVDKNRDFFVEWIPFVSRTHDLEDAQVLVKDYLERYALGKGLFYGLWDGEWMVGFILAREIDLEAEWAEIGYMVDRDYAGRGLIKEACSRLIAYLFDEMALKKIVICCNEKNESSKALAERFGFQLEGRLRKHFVVNGQVVDMLCYGLLREERRP